MSLEICETITPEKFILKDARFFKSRVRLTIEPGAEYKFTKVSDELYFKQKKVYFPIFKTIIFSKVSKDDKYGNNPMIFKGNFIEYDEIVMIKSLIQENNEKENQKYEEYKKNLDKEISSIISSMNTEISHQKEFLKDDLLTNAKYNENIKTLVSSYADMIMIKLNKDINLGSDDRNNINKFYSNMIAGLGDNNTNKEILIDVKNQDKPEETK